MTEQEFFKGWTMLLVQPWARMYTFGEGAEEREAVQIGLYKSRFVNMPGWRWMTGCQRWVETEDHWPTMAELHDAMKKYAPMPTLSKFESPALPVPKETVADENYLPRRVYAFARQHNISMSEAVKKLIPTWLNENPSHPDQERARALVASLDTKPILVVKGMPTLAEFKHEWSTDFSANACKGRCTFCKQTSDIVVCWCRSEGCRPCLGTHQPHCRTGSIVNGI